MEAKVAQRQREEPKRKFESRATSKSARKEARRRQANMHKWARQSGRSSTCTSRNFTNLKNRSMSRGRRARG